MAQGPNVVPFVIAAVVALAAVASVATWFLVSLLRERRRNFNFELGDDVALAKGSSRSSSSCGSGVIVLQPATAASVAAINVQPGVDQIDFGHKSQDPLLSDQLTKKASLSDLEDLRDVIMLPPESDGDGDSASLGEILLKVQFVSTQRQLHITAVRACQLQRCGIAELQPHCQILLLPGKSKPLRTQTCFGSDTHPIWRRHFVIEGFQQKMLKWHYFRAQVWHGTKRHSAQLLGETQVILAKLPESQLEKGVAMWRRLRVIEDEDNLTHGSAKIRVAFIKSMGILEFTLFKTQQLFLFERYESANKFAASVSLYCDGQKRAMSRTPVVTGSHLQVWNHSVTFPYLQAQEARQLALKIVVKDVTDLSRRRTVAVLELSDSSDREECSELWRKLPQVGGKGVEAELKLSPPPSKEPRS